MSTLNCIFSVNGKDKTVFLSFPQVATWRDIWLRWEVEPIASTFQDSKGRSEQLRLSWEMVINGERKQGITFYPGSWLSFIIEFLCFPLLDGSLSRCWAGVFWNVEVSYCHSIVIMLVTKPRPRVAQICSPGMNSVTHSFLQCGACWAPNIWRVEAKLDLLLLCLSYAWLSKCIINFYCQSVCISFLQWYKIP